jgi:ATPase subunit of ABC transporter with duplicated ATPase domains
LWLESFLQTWQGSFVLVSHDNTLLDAVTIRLADQRPGQQQARVLPAA